jgi:hypothetical protein
MACSHNPQKETPLAATGGASRDSFGGLSRTPSTLAFQRAQFLMLSHAVRPEMAVMLAAIIFEGGKQ